MIDMASPDFWPNLFAVLLEGTWETLYMTAVAMAITFVVGLPLGIILVGTEQGRFLERPFGSRALGRIINALLGFVVNLGRSVPFIVLMIALIPLTRWLLGSFIGTGPAIVPLTLVAIPFFVRVVEIAVREVDPGLFEAAESLGASPLAARAPRAAAAGDPLDPARHRHHHHLDHQLLGDGRRGRRRRPRQRRPHATACSATAGMHIVGVIIILFLLVQLIQWALTALARTLGAPSTRRGPKKDAMADAQAHLDVDLTTTRTPTVPSGP